MPNPRSVNARFTQAILEAAQRHGVHVPDALRTALTQGARVPTKRLGVRRGASGARHESVELLNVLAGFENKEIEEAGGHRRRGEVRERADIENDDQVRCVETPRASASVAVTTTEPTSSSTSPAPTMP